MIRIDYKQIRRKTGKVLNEGSFKFVSVESALKYILEYHNDLNEYEATYVEFAPFVEEIK